MTFDDAREELRLNGDSDLEDVVRVLLGMAVFADIIGGADKRDDAVRIAGELLEARADRLHGQPAPITVAPYGLARQIVLPDLAVARDEPRAQDARHEHPLVVSPAGFHVHVCIRFFCTDSSGRTGDTSRRNVQRRDEF